MTLRELAAEFIGNASAHGYQRQDGIHGAQGVLFQCPACSVGKPPAEEGGFAGAHCILVCFSNPVAAPVAPAELDHNPRWEMSGSSLDDLTLSPSVNTGCWHGHVRNGDAA